MFSYIEKIHQITVDSQSRENSIDPKNSSNKNPIKCTNLSLSYIDSIIRVNTNNDVEIADDKEFKSIMNNVENLYGVTPNNGAFKVTPRAADELRKLHKTKLNRIGNSIELIGKIRVLIEILYVNFFIDKDREPTHFKVYSNYWNKLLIPLNDKFIREKYKTK